MYGALLLVLPGVAATPLPSWPWHRPTDDGNYPTMSNAQPNFLPIRLVDEAGRTIGRTGDAVGCFIALEGTYVMHSSLLDVNGDLTNGYYQAGSADPGFNGAGGAPVCEVTPGAEDDVVFLYYDSAALRVYPLALARTSDATLEACAAKDAQIASLALGDGEEAALCEAGTNCAWVGGACSVRYARGDSTFRRGVEWSASATGFDAARTVCETCWSFYPVRTTECAACDRFTRFSSDTHGSASPLDAQRSGLELPYTLCAPGDEGASHRSDGVDAAQSPAECYAAQTRALGGGGLLQTPLTRRCIAANETGGARSCYAPDACASCAHASGAACVHNGSTCVAAREGRDTCGACDAVLLVGGTAITLDELLADEVCRTSAACDTLCRWYNGTKCAFFVDAYSFDCTTVRRVSNGLLQPDCAPLDEPCTCGAPLAPPPAPPPPSPGSSPSAHRASPPPPPPSPGSSPTARPPPPPSPVSQGPSSPAAEYTCSELDAELRSHLCCRMPSDACDALLLLREGQCC